MFVFQSVEFFQAYFEADHPSFWNAPPPSSPSANTCGAFINGNCGSWEGKKEGEESSCVCGATGPGRPAAGAPLTSRSCPWASPGHPGRSSIRTSCRPVQISPCCTGWLLPTPASLALTERNAAAPQRPRSLQNKGRLMRFSQLCSN